MKTMCALFAILLGSVMAFGQAESVNSNQVSTCPTPTNPPQVTIPAVDCTQDHVIWLDIDWLPGNSSAIVGRPTSQFCPLDGSTCQWFGGFTEFATTGSPGDSQPGLHRYYETCPAGFGKGSVNIHPIVIASVKGNSCYTFKADY
ncbi:MAG: hypothetical protein WBX03_02525 [Terriglobales bacterium]|jgi:hypothetical protein